VGGPETGGEEEISEEAQIKVTDFQGSLMRGSRLLMGQEGSQGGGSLRREGIEKCQWDTAHALS